MKKTTLFFTIAVLLITACSKPANSKDSTEKAVSQTKAVSETYPDLITPLKINIKYKCEDYQSISGANFEIDTLLITEDDLPKEQIVDLGLGVYWAGWNIGASSPVESGSFFGYNDATPQKEFSDIGNDSIIDVARANWGNEWRMPTDDDIKELTDRCKWIWCKYDTKGKGYIYGFKVVGPNENFIFIPAAGYIYEKQRLDRNANCVFRSISGNTYKVFADQAETIINLPPFEGFTNNKTGIPIRPVMDL